jgi:acyl-coenzyme A synthetase/AMP-(fatty) acid ligase
MPACLLGIVVPTGEVGNPSPDSSLASEAAGNIEIATLRVPRALTVVDKLPRTVLCKIQKHVLAGRKPI